MMNRKIALAVSAATLMEILWAGIPALDRSGGFGVGPTLAKEEPKQGCEPETGTKNIKQVSEKPQPKIAENDFEGRLKAIEEKVKSDFKELLDARNKDMEAYKTRFFAHLEAKLKEAQARGDLDAYEKWNDRKERFQRLQNLDDWVNVLYRCENSRWIHVNGMEFKSTDIEGTEAPNFKELYLNSIRKAYQEADKAAEEVQRDALRSGDVEEAKRVRKWRVERLKKLCEHMAIFIIEGRREE